MTIDVIVFVVHPDTLKEPVQPANGRIHLPVLPEGMTWEQVVQEHLGSVQAERAAQPAEGLGRETPS